MKAVFNVRRKLTFSSVPDVVLQDKGLSFAARVTLGWMLGRSDDFQIQIKYMIEKLGLSDKTWPRVRRELMARGFFRQIKRKNGDGKFEWTQEVTDAPLYDQPPPLPKGGMETIPPKCRDGESRDAKGGDIPIGGLYQSDFTTLPPSPPAPLGAACSSTRGEGEGGMEEIDYSNLTGVTAALGRSPRVHQLLQGGGQALADALEASIRWGIRSDNPVRFPERIVEKTLLSLPIEELEARGSEVRQERQQRKAIHAAHEKAAKRILDDPEASEKGKALISQLRKKRDQDLHPRSS
jgi:hypothetical protein